MTVIDPTVADDNNVRPGLVVRTSEFWILWFTFFLNTQAITYINSMYKAFGQEFIDDDHFLAVVGAVAAVFNSTGRLFWGQVSVYERFVLIGYSRFTELLLPDVRRVRLSTLHDVCDRVGGTTLCHPRAHANNSSNGTRWRQGRLRHLGMVDLLLLLRQFRPPAHRLGAVLWHQVRKQSF